MTVDQPQASVVVDTSVFSYFAAQAPLGDTYRELLAGRTIALSFFVKTELDGRDWDELRRARLDALYQYCVYLEPTEATSNWYNAAHRRRREMRKSGVGDTDLWIIAHAAEYDVPYMSHDRGACELARALGVDVLTALGED